MIMLGFVLTRFMFKEVYMTNPKISVIVPVYNVAEFLPDCLDSLLSQNFDAMEIICVDDKSTDNSLEILEDYASKDKRIRVIKHEQNRGLGEARNSGLKVATGEYIHFLDSDDWIDNGVYEKLIPIIEENKLDFLSFTLKKFDEFSKEPFEIFAWDNNICEKVLDPMENSIVFKFIEAVCLRIYSSSFLSKNNLMFKSLRNEDTPFYIECLLKAKRIMFINEPFYNYRIRKNSIMNTRFDCFESYFKWFEVLQEISRGCENKSIGDEISRNALAVLYDAFNDFLSERFLKALLFSPRLNHFIKSYPSFSNEKFYRNVIKLYLKTHCQKLFICCIKLKKACGKILSCTK